MGFTAGTADVGEDVTPVCSVPSTGVRVKNLGGSTVYLGGPDVATEGSSAGFPVEAGASETIQGTVVKETPIVPAPPRDTDDAVLYGRTAAGTGISKVAFISVTMV